MAPSRTSSSSYARLDDDRGRSKGRASKRPSVGAFIVEKGFPGFRVAQKLSKMGFRGSQTGELVFDNCSVPAANILGGESGGLAVLMGGLDIERAMIAPLCLGIAERALELSIDYARTRRQFGQRIGSFQMVRAKLADMYVWVETMRCLRIACFGKHRVSKRAAAAGARSTSSPRRQ